MLLWLPLTLGSWHGVAWCFAVAPHMDPVAEVAHCARALFGARLNTLEHDLHWPLCLDRGPGGYIGPIFPVDVFDLRTQHGTLSRNQVSQRLQVRLRNALQGHAIY